MVLKQETAQELSIASTGSQSNRSGFETHKGREERENQSRLNPTVVVLKHDSARMGACKGIRLNPTVVVLKPSCRSCENPSFDGLNPTVVVLKQLPVSHRRWRVMCLNPTVVVLKPHILPVFPYQAAGLNPTVVVLKRSHFFFHTNSQRRSQSNRSGFETWQ